MEKSKSVLIKCPKCGCEYLPGEIYLPKAFLGQPKNIVRDNDTEIIAAPDGAEMDLEEKFTCEKCGTPFRVYATVSFNTVLEEDVDPNTDYSTKIKTDIFSLNED